MVKTGEGSLVGPEYIEHLISVYGPRCDLWNQKLGALATHLPIIGKEWEHTLNY